MNKYELNVYHLLEDSKEFEQLNKKINKFNPFKILKVDQFEIRHSNILAWLLDSSGNHNLGSFFFKKLLAKVILKQDNEGILPNYNLDLLHINDNSFEDLKISREVLADKGRRIDLLATSEGGKLVVLIENKYKSGESQGQLTDYLNYVNKNYPGYNVLPVFLSLYGVEPTNDKYLKADYSDVLNILNDFIMVNKEFINNSIYEFLKYYIDILEDELVKDEEELELASEIYKLHKDAIDLLLISDNYARKSVEKLINKELQDYYNKLKNDYKENYHKIYLKHKQTIDFILTIGNDTMREAFLRFAEEHKIPKDCYIAHVRVPSFILPRFRELNNIIGVPKYNYWLNNIFIIWFERLGDNRLKVNIEIGPVEYDKRLIILNNLEKRQIKIKSSSKEADAVYTKIYTSSIEVEDWTDKKEIFEGMESLYNDSGMQDVLKSIYEVIDEVSNKIDEKSEDKGKVEITPADISKNKLAIGEAFLDFISGHNIPEGMYVSDARTPYFILPEFRAFDTKLGLPKWKWWLDNALIIWFEKLRDNRLKLVIEIGPLEHGKRVQLLNKLEEKGIKIKAKSKETDASYTRIFTPAKLVKDWNDRSEILMAMNELYDSEECKRIVEDIVEVAEGM